MWENVWRGVPSYLVGGKSRSKRVPAERRPHRRRHGERRGSRDRHRYGLCKGKNDPFVFLKHIQKFSSSRTCSLRSLSSLSMAWAAPKDDWVENWKLARAWWKMVRRNARLNECTPCFWKSNLCVWIAKKVPGGAVVGGRKPSRRVAAHVEARHLGVVGLCGGEGSFYGFLKESIHFRQRNNSQSSFPKCAPVPYPHWPF